MTYQEALAGLQPHRLDFNRKEWKRQKNKLKKHYYNYNNRPAPVVDLDDAIEEMLLQQEAT